MNESGKGWNRMFSLVLIVALLVSSVPAARGVSSVWNGKAAAGFAGGTGTEDDPYIIETGAQLAYLAQSVNAGNSYSGKYFKLVNNITLNTADMFARDEGGKITGKAAGKTPNEWTPIGVGGVAWNPHQGTPFAGIFDGDKHKIIGIYTSGGSFQGLFGYCENATIKNLGIVDGYVKGGDYVGGVVGKNYARASGSKITVTNCYNTSAVSGYDYVGGVVGYNEANSGTATVTNCYNTGAVTAKNYVGGVVGYNEANSGTVTVSNCYNTGTVAGGVIYIGGVVGWNRAETGTAAVTNCYNTGAVSGSDDVGGVVGLNLAVDSRSKVTVRNCYYLSGTAAVGIYNTSIGNATTPISSVIALSDTQMCVASSFSGFNFATDWTMNGNPHYPYPELIGTEHEDAVPVCSHEFGEWITVSASTCTTNGVAERTCSTCGASETKALALDPTNHAGGTQIRNQTPAICTEDGYTGDTYCKGCGEKLSEGETVDALGHVWSEWTVTAEATAVADGEQTRTCARCGETETMSTPATGFVDVGANKFYYASVMWAAKEGITTGVDETHFAPNADCTRAQAVMFLWNAAGCPEVDENTVNPFSDVKESRYYYKAVLWAISAGITDGTDATHFSPNEKLNRSTFVTFLWRAKGKQDVPVTDKFTDVKANKFYATAVAWAVANGITDGINDTTFAPNNLCTRAQVVTFLYRAYQ